MVGLCFGLNLTQTFGVSISSPSSEGGGCFFFLVCFLVLAAVSISSPSSEGGGSGNP